MYTDKPAVHDLFQRTGDLAALVDLVEVELEEFDQSQFICHLFYFLFF